MAQDGTRPPRAPATGSDPGGGELRAVNERLRELIESLRVERERRAQAPPPTPAPSAVEPATAIESLEKRRLESELAAAREAAEERRREEERLRSRLAEVEVEHQRVCDEYVSVEEQASDLATMYVALERLHGTLDPAGVLDAIQEIVINMVGCEELGIYDVAEEGRELRLARGFGLGAARPERIPLGAGTLGRVARTGTPYVAGRAEPSEDLDLTACIPLRLGGRVTGVLALYRMLGHKPVLEERDGRLFELLGTHAAAALHLARMHAQGAGAR